MIIYFFQTVEKKQSKSINFNKTQIRSNDELLKELKISTSLYCNHVDFCSKAFSFFSELKINEQSMFEQILIEYIKEESIKIKNNKLDNSFIFTTFSTQNPIKTLNNTQNFSPKKNKCQSSSYVSPLKQTQCSNIKESFYISLKQELNENLQYPSAPKIKPKTYNLEKISPLKLQEYSPQKSTEKSKK